MAVVNENAAAVGTLPRLRNNAGIIPSIVRTPTSDNGPPLRHKAKPDTAPVIAPWPTPYL